MDTIEYHRGRASRLREAIRKIEHDIDEQVRAYRKQLLDLHAAVLSENRKSLADAEQQADKLVEAKQYAEAQALLTHPLVGQRLYEWSKGRWGLGPYGKTGKVGIVEPWTPALKDMRKIGWGHSELVIRHLKKDGTVGKVYEYASLNEDGTAVYDWYPEGVDPNKEKV